MSHTDKAELQGVLDALNEISVGGLRDLSMGICDNVDCLLLDEDGYGLAGYATWEEHRRKAFEVWDKFSGVPEYPVQDPSAPGTPSMQFRDHYETGTLWEGVQGKLRQDLLGHLIKYFTDRLEGASV